MDELRKYFKQKEDEVFAQACELGKEEELFNMTKEQKESMDRLLAFNKAFHEMPDTDEEGHNAGAPLTDFFVSLL